MSSWCFGKTCAAPRNDATDLHQEHCLEQPLAVETTHPATTRGRRSGQGDTMSHETTVTSYRLRRFATILLGTVALIFVTTAGSNAVAQCQTSGRSCGGNSASNDGRCCAGLVCGTTGCCTAGCRINNTLYGSGATNPQNPCQSCQPSVSTTSWTNKSPGTTCNDNNACTTQDKCQAGTCSGTALSCDDHNSCTQDTCDPARGCVRQNLNGTCDDGNACTLGDTCSYGTCRAGTGRLTCNDNNACTNDTCSSSQGCVYTNNTNTCSDGNACTVGDKCGGGTCQPGAGRSTVTMQRLYGRWVRSDARVQALDNTSSCSGRTRARWGDTCGGGSCASGPNSCDDSNPCTNDICDRYCPGGYKHTKATRTVATTTTRTRARQVQQQEGLQGGARERSPATTTTRARTTRAAPRAGARARTTPGPVTTTARARRGIPAPAEPAEERLAFATTTTRARTTRAIRRPAASTHRTTTTRVSTRPPARRMRA